MATEKKYVSLSKLSTFLDNLKIKFATITHTHKISDITDYKVDDALSSTSKNPVQNEVLNEEFEAISKALTVYENALDDKADSSALSNYYTKTEIDNLELITVNDIDTICSQTIQVATASEVTF